MRGGWLLFLCCSCFDFIIAGLLDFIILIAEIRMKRSSLRGGSCIFLCRSWSRCRQLLSLPTHVLVNERNIFTKPKQIFYTAKTNISHHQKKCFTPVEEIFLHGQKKHWQKKYFHTTKYFDLIKTQLRFLNIETWTDVIAESVIFDSPSWAKCWF